MIVYVPTSEVISGINISFLIILLFILHFVFATACNNIILLTPKINYRKQNFDLLIKDKKNEIVIPFNNFKKAIPCLKNALGNDWNKKYKKYEGLKDISQEDWAFIRKLLSKETLDDNEIKNPGFSILKRENKVKEEKVFSFLILCIICEQDYGKRIIPKDLDVPDVLHTIARYIHLDL